MENLEKLDLVELKSAELQEIEGGITWAALGRIFWRGVGTGAAIGGAVYAAKQLA